MGHLEGPDLGLTLSPKGRHGWGRELSWPERSQKQRPPDSWTWEHPFTFRLCNRKCIPPTNKYSTLPTPKSIPDVVYKGKIHKITYRMTQGKEKEIGPGRKQILMREPRPKGTRQSSQPEEGPAGQI